LSDDALALEFAKSWDRMASFFGSGEVWPKRPDVVDFIAALRQVGYDRKLRAGQSLDTFVVSRSRRHGLQAEQPIVGFHIYEGKMEVHSRGLHAETFVESTQPLSGRVRDLLDRLSNEPIT
jgi:hypothetical protein